MYKPLAINGHDFRAEKMHFWGPFDASHECVFVCLCVCVCVFERERVRERERERERK